MPTQGRRASLPETPDDDPREVPVAEEPEPEEEVIAPTDEDVEDDDEEEFTRLEDLDPATELFPNGPTVGTVLQWKAQYEGVFVTSFDVDSHYVWRPINRFEYRRLVKQMEQSIASGVVTQAEANLNNEEAMCELCILWPTFSRAEMAAEAAGVAAIISQQIMEASKFVAIDVREL